MVNRLNKKIRILVVDDDKDISWLIVRILKEESFAVDIAHNIESALEKVASHSYHLIVLDYKLSGKSGLFVLDKTHQLSPATITIMISAFGNDTVKKKAKEFGAYDFLDKPFNINGLKKTVRKALTEQKRRCINEANLRKLPALSADRHARFSSTERLGSSGFCTGTNSSGSVNDAKDRHPVYIGAG